MRRFRFSRYIVFSIYLYIYRSQGYGTWTRSCAVRSSKTFLPYTLGSPWECPVRMTHYTVFSIILKIMKTRLRITVLLQQKARVAIPSWAWAAYSHIHNLPRIQNQVAPCAQHPLSFTSFSHLLTTFFPSLIYHICIHNHSTFIFDVGKGREHHKTLAYTQASSLVVFKLYESTKFMQILNQIKG
jgi:hypothetical protein